jgi:hypothetical protein
MGVEYGVVLFSRLAADTMLPVPAGDAFLTRERLRGKVAGLSRNSIADPCSYQA